MYKQLRKEEKLKASDKDKGKAKDKGRYIHLNAEVQRIARRDKKAFLSDYCKEIEEYNRIGKTSDPFGEDNDIPLQYSCLENHMDRRGWQAPVHGVTESQI